MDSPQFLYLILIIPGVFGVTLLGEGIYKIVTARENAMVTLMFGIVFLAVVVFSYFFFSIYLTPQI